MLRRLFNRQSLRTAMPFYLAMLLLVLSTLIVVGGGAFFYSLFRVAREDELDTRLRAIGRAATPGIAQVADLTMGYLLDPEYAGWDREALFRTLIELDHDGDFQAIGACLRALREADDLESVMLISPEGRVISDADGALSPGAAAPLLEVDQFAWQPALKGHIASTPYYEIDGVPHKRLYVPIRLKSTTDSKKTPVGGVLRLEASFQAARELERLRNQALILGAALAVLMLTVALLFLRLIRAFARLTETAAHRDRLQAMGALTAGIAHEIRNPLGIIRALAEGLSGDFDDDDPNREMVDDIVGEVERLNRLVNQYLAFARPDAGPGEQAQPTELMRDLAHLLERDGSEAAPVEVVTPSDLPPVRMSEPALRQVLLNILLNARDASPPDRPIAMQASLVRGGNMVEIVVTDRGPGIPARDLKRVFEPFFTTRTQGSGLGLAICRSLISDCKGRIEIDSREGQGTTVRIAVPVGKAPE